MARTVEFKVREGTPIHCGGCEERIGRALGRIPGVETVQASRETQEVHVTFDPEQATAEQVRAKLARAGFEIHEEEA